MMLRRWLDPDLRDLHLLPTWDRFGGVPGPVWTLALGHVFRGVTMLAISVAPIGGARLGPDRPIIGAASLLMGLAMLNRRWRVPGWVLHFLVTTWVAFVCWLMATAVSPLSISINLLGLMGVSMYVGVWFPQRQMVMHQVFVATASFVGLVLFGAVRTYISLWLGSMIVMIFIGVIANMLMQHMMSLATQDLLTGLLNRFGLETIIDRPDAVATLGSPVTVVMIDLDGFKRINDEQGHHAGDEMLRKVGAALRSHLRKSDVIVRTGGDEFLLILPRTSVSDADVIVQRVLGRMPMAASFGLADWAVGESFDFATARADHSMYANKLGKHRSSPRP